MKIIPLIGVFFSSSFSNLFAQLSVAPFYSWSYQKASTETKNGPKTFGAALAYDFNEIVGVGFQFRNAEFWRFNEKIERTITMRTLSLHFNLSGRTEKGKWFCGPMAGVFVGAGSVIPEKEIIYFRQQSSPLPLLKHPYFGGMFLQVSGGVWLPEKIRLALFIRTEAMGGVVAKRSFGIQSNMSSTGIFSTGLCLSFGKEKL